MARFQLELLEPERADDFEGNQTAAARSLLSDRRQIHLIVLLFNLRVCITDGPGMGFGWDDGYCFHDPVLAWLCFMTWDGESTPIGFAKNPFTGERGDCPCDSCEFHRSEAARF